MLHTLILWPVLIQILLTISLFVLLGRRKKLAYKNNLVDPRKTALDNSAWPDDVVKVSNNIQNQFQTPVLFFVLCLSFLVLQQVSWLVLSLAWMFCILRILHAYVHVGSNYVPLRFRLFLFSVLVLLAMALSLGQLLLRG
ncbi:MAG: hypothetical protein GW763_06255 [Paraglaciecola sp.]|nr:hypothetical protein [Paraglaciecola sp.]NCT47586.1 hypothetical protein [Paraglaciecola sp.]